MTKAPSRQFNLLTASTSYVVSLLPDRSGLILDQWGPLTDQPAESPTPTPDPAHEVGADVAPLEYTSNGTRFSHFSEMVVHYPTGVAGTRWRVDETSIASDDPGGGYRLDVPLDDETGTLRLVLHTRTNPRHDVVRRWVSVLCSSDAAGPVELRRCFSAGWALPVDHPARIDYLTGEWGREFRRQQVTLGVGTFSMGSRRGFTGHEFAPVLTAAGADDPLRAYGVALAFSGSWRINVEATAKTGGAGNRLRVSGGVDDQDTVIRLFPGDRFTTPECHGLFSPRGTEGVRQGLHHFQRSVLARDLSPRTRPVVYNSWYATEFDIRTEHQIALADRAADLGVEVFVVDDGWMPRRTNDTRGLGDWWADPDRFPDGLHPIADAVLRRGMRFGLWVEPEMVTTDSEVYRAHPEWVYRAGDRPLTYLRHQLVLDFGREAVVDWASDALRNLLASYPISYLKWDFNRLISDGGRPDDPHGGEWAVQHAQGYHRVMQMLRDEFPDVTIEACASGGGRIDHSVLAVSDVVWPSDETGPRDRLVVQDGFLTAYPPHVMSSWVTAMKGTDDTGPVSFAYRFVVAMAGVLGIGADITQWTSEQLDHARRLVALYKDIRSVIHTGQVRAHGRPGGPGYALEYADAPADPDRVVLLIYDSDRDRRDREVRIRPHGLHPDARYRLRDGGPVISGASAVATGLVVPFRLAEDCDVLILDRVD